MVSPRLILAIAAVLLAACGSSGGGNTSDPAPSEPLTGMTLTVEYDNSDRVTTVSLSGATAMTARRFGPYVLSSTKLGSGDTVGFTFDAGDAGMAMICGDARDANGRMQATGCDSFPVRAGEITAGTLWLDAVFTH